MQVIIGIDIAEIFRFIIEENPKFLPIICAIYPNIMGLIAKITNKVNNKTGLEFKYEIILLSTLLAGIPYRLIYFTVDDW